MINLFSKIQNGYLNNKQNISINYTKLNSKLLYLFYKNGYILNFFIVTQSNKKKIKILLNYKNDVPVLTKIKIISKPSCKVFCNLKYLTKQKNNNNFYIISTSKGFLSSIEAKKLLLGGELICQII
jgi:small subunit ribosomal protein S8